MNRSRWLDLVDNRMIDNGRVGIAFKPSDSGLHSMQLGLDDVELREAGSGCRPHVADTTIGIQFERVDFAHTDIGVDLEGPLSVKDQRARRQYCEREYVRENCRPPQRVW